MRNLCVIFPIQCPFELNSCIKTNSFILNWQEKFGLLYIFQNIFYSHENNYISLLPVFAAKVDCRSKIKICYEHYDWKWIKPGGAKKLLAWPGQKKSIDIITEYFLKKRNFLDMIEAGTRMPNLLNKFYVLKKTFIFPVLRISRCRW